MQRMTSDYSCVTPCLCCNQKPKLGCKQFEFTLKCRNVCTERASGLWIGIEGGSVWGGGVAPLAQRKKGGRRHTMPGGALLFQWNVSHCIELVDQVYLYSVFCIKYFVFCVVYFALCSMICAVKYFCMLGLPSICSQSSLHTQPKGKVQKKEKC